jgi:hypothetical protein
LVDLQHILHAGYEGGFVVWRDDPLLLEMWLERVFLSVWLIVLSLARPSGIKALFDQSLTDTPDGVDAGVQRLGDLAVTPSFAGLGGVRLQRMRAFNNWRAGASPFWISIVSRSRSSVLSQTMYFLTAGCFAITAYLQGYRR